MLVLLSPAKTLDFESPVAVEAHSTPEFLEQARLLNTELRQLAPQDLASLMKLSDKLADLNHRRNQEWSTPFTRDNARQAIAAFRGDVYAGLQADQWSEADHAWAQDHLRILSGLYGLLRPLDLMQAYRLEMGTRLQNSEGKDLYAFWGTQLTDALNGQLDAADHGAVVNLASNEYWHAIQPEALHAPVISPVFKDWKNGQYKLISFHAKKARGMMASWIVRNRISEPEQLKDFDVAGYRHAAAESSPERPVFLRDGTD